MSYHIPSLADWNGSFGRMSTIWHEWNFGIGSKKKKCNENVNVEMEITVMHMNSETCFKRLTMSGTTSWLTSIECLRKIFVRIRRCETMRANEHAKKSMLNEINLDTIFNVSPLSPITYMILTILFASHSFCFHRFKCKISCLLQSDSRASSRL